MDGWAEISRPGPDTVTIADVPVGVGSRVVLHPRSTRDVFAAALSGKCAVVDAVVQDIEDQVLLAVVLENDPARDLGKGRQLGHRFFFAPDEVDPVSDEATGPARRVLVAGVGNIFMGDDGFGVAVAGRLAERVLPAGVQVADFGIRGMDLAYALGDGYEAVVIVDATPRGEPPGTVSVIEPEIDDGADVPVDGHGMDPARVLLLARRFGRVPARTLVVGCEPQPMVDDPDVTGELVDELSAPVAGALDQAVAVVESLVAELVRTPDQVSVEEGE